MFFRAIFWIQILAQKTQQDCTMSNKSPLPVQSSDEEDMEDDFDEFGTPRQGLGARGVDREE